jgi:integrase
MEQIHIYTPDNVTLYVHRSGDKFYLRWQFSYGDETFRASTGIALQCANEWIKPKEQTQDLGKGFQDPFIARHGKNYGKLLEQLSTQRQGIFDAFTLLTDKLEHLPRAEQLSKHLKEPKTASTSRIRLAEWITTEVPTLPSAMGTPLAPRSVAKYLGVASIITALEAVRKHRKYRKHFKGAGPIYVQTFSTEDYQDFGKLLDLSSCEIGRAFALYGVDGISLNGPQEQTRKRQGTGYTLSTKQKAQANLVHLLKQAKRQGLKLTVDFDLLQKVQRGAPQTDYALTPEDVQLILSHQCSGAMENIRRLFLLQLFTGSRYSDLKGILMAPTFDYKGVKMFVHLSTKTASKVCSPIFSPILPFMANANERPTLVSEQHLNRGLKQLAASIGLTRPLLITALMADGTRMQRNTTLADEISTHIARRTVYSILADLGIDSVLVTKALTGHTNTREAHSGYDKRSPEDVAFRLHQRIREAQHELPFAFV